MSVGNISPAKVEAATAAGCPPLQVAFSGNVPQPGQTYAWTFGDQWYSASANPIHVYEEPGIYHLVVVTRNQGCIDSARSDINVYEKPLSIFNHNFETKNYMIGESALELENKSIGAFTWLWAFGTGDTANVFEPRMTYKIPGDYTIELISISPSGCLDIMKKEIKVRNKEFIYVPNAFSPNGDQINDLFFMLSTNISSANISIFNRWGQFFFKSDEKDFHWDGTYQGQPVEAGVYGYLIDAVGESGRIYSSQGTVTVVR